MVRSRTQPLRLDAGIFLVSFGLLSVELLLTRIFSVTMYHHFSFLAVTLAMLGLGAGGLAVTLRPERFRPERLAAQASAGALLLSLSTVCVVWLAFQLPVSGQSGVGGFLNLCLVLTAAVLPFASGGLVVALILTHRVESAGRLYGVDLLGAAAACAAFVPATEHLGAPTAVLLVAAIAALGGAVLAGGRRRWQRTSSVGAATLLALLGLLNARHGFYDVKFAKGERQPPTLLTRWNAYSRVEVIGTPADLVRPRRPFGFGYSSELPDVGAREVYLRYDAGAMTQITGFDGEPADVQYLGFDVAAAPYQMRRHRDVLVLGAGGGRDVLAALALGSGPVTAVEVNPLTIDLMRGRFAGFTGGLYAGFPGVEAVRDDGRNFLRRGEGRYDVIQASLVDTWAASAAGAYALAENSLYTVEAFREYLERLTAGGVIAFSRWYNEPPVEVMRVVVLALAALRREGIGDPAGHIMVVRTRRELTGHPSLATVLVKRSPFLREEVVRLRTWAAELRFDVPLDPLAPGTAEAGFAELAGRDAARFLRTAPYDVSPVTDDRPFFFDRVPLLAWLGHRLGLPAPASGKGKLTLGGKTLLAALAVSLLFVLLLIVAPLTGRRAHGNPDGSPPVARGGRRAGWLVFFLGLGLGYIIVEIVTIQRLNLYLGNPAHALSVVLFTMLSASGAGSLVAHRRLRHRSPAVLAALCCAAVLVFAWLFPRTVASTLGSGTVVRLAAPVGMLAPVAFLMGMPFPAGLRAVSALSAPAVSWAWAINAAASVLGSASAVLVSMSFGFSAALWVGVAAYATAALGGAALPRAGAAGSVGARRGPAADDAGLRAAATLE
ncbi:MAG: hypothetical protein ACE5HP_02695 [Gemmatimonadota bacterium]